MKPEGTRTPRRVLLVAPLPPPYGGISHWTQQMVLHCEALTGVKLSILDTAVRDREVYELARTRRYWIALRGLPAQLFSFNTALRWPSPDAIHLTTSGKAALARDTIFAVIAKTKRVPMIVHIRSGHLGDQTPPPWSPEGLLLMVLLRLVATVVVLDARSQRVSQKLAPRSRVYVAPNFIDTSRAPLLRSEATNLPTSQKGTILFLGWVIPTKGIRELVDAWSECHRTGWKLILVGPCKPEFQAELLRRSRVPESLVFRGSLPHHEAMEALSSSDIFAFPSYSEGFPNAILEAMNHACAIVATTVGAIPEMVDGEAILIQPRDTKGLAEAIAALMDDPAWRTQMGGRLRRRARECYDQKGVISQYVKLWSDSLRD